MAAVTYIPRALPAMFIDKLKWNKKMEKFLGLIPYTALAALVVPGVFYVDETRISIGAAGAAAACLLSFFKAPVMVVIAGAVAVDMLLYIYI